MTTSIVPIGADHFTFGGRGALVFSEKNVSELKTKNKIVADDPGKKNFLSLEVSPYV